MLSRRDLVLGFGSALAVFALPARAVAAGKVYRVPVDLASRRLLVTCTIEGKGPYRLGIDTGGVVSMIRSDLAKALGLGQRGVTPLGLAGRYERYPMFEARELVFGNAFRQERVLLAGVEDAGFGRDVVGMLAAGCLTTMDSELDFDALEWRLYPDGLAARPGWVAHDKAIRPSRIGSPHLFGEVRLGGQKLRCLFDTGAPGPILLTPKVARMGGIDIDGQNWSPSEVNGRDARIFRSNVPIEIGGLTVQRALVRVTDEVPNFIEDGIVGLPTIQRMNLMTEVKAGRLWTRPNNRPPEPDGYNASGLWIDRKGRQLIAGRVGRGSPAEKAGIAPGDRIEGLEFGPLLALLNGRPGSEAAFTVSRGGARRDVRLLLEDYL